jgi:hypothetical protein
MGGIIQADSEDVFVAERSEGGLCGFVGTSVHPWANGYSHRPVGPFSRERTHWCWRRSYLPFIARNASSSRVWESLRCVNQPTLGIARCWKTPAETPA